MSRILCTLALAVVFAISIALPATAADDERVAKKLIDQVDDGDPAFYTTAHGFMNDQDLNADNGGPLEKGLYLMSWLVTDPPICVGAGQGGTGSMGKDLMNQVFGVKEDDVAGDPKNWPIAGQKGKKLEDNAPACTGDPQWAPINFQDLEDAKEGALFASGNQFDWAKWGGRGSDDFHVYLFCLVMWNKSGAVDLAAGSDDPETTWVDGEVVMEGLANRNWTADTEQASINVKAGEWVAILAELGERGGEAGYTLRVEPPPDDHTLDVEGAQAVDALGKLTTTWGRVKSAAQ